MTYLEAIEDDARCNFQFDQTGGSGKAFYHTPIGSAPNIQQIIFDVLGYTNPTGNGGSQALNRLLPVTHPKCPYLYGNRITSLIGKGSGNAVRVSPVQPSNPAIGANPIAQFFQYQQYEIGVDFASRPYPILTNAAFSAIQSGSWAKKDGTTETFTYATEWSRYTDYDYFPQDNTIQGQQGNMSLVTTGTATDSVPFTSPPWMWLPDQILKVKWYQVPYRFITSSNSYIAGGPNRNWRGRVNQNAWWNWPAGSLLYMGYSVHKYTPPFNDVDTYPTYTSVGDGAMTVLGDLVNYSRLCDIELTFLYTNRYRSGSLGGTITNGNYIPQGHNLLPNLGDNKFYYAVRNPKGATTGDRNNPPAWYSFPVEALFSDPDAAGGPTTAGDN